MKWIPSLALTALLSTGVALAASTPTAKPASNATPAAATHKHNSVAHCERQAKEKKLMGHEKEKFLQECKDGKKTD
jgi:hypothetical protein